MRDEREKRDWREITRTSYTCANPAYLASPTQLARHTFLASPARRASRAPCGRSSALSLTDLNRTPHTQCRPRAEAPRLIRAVRVSVPFPVALPTVLTVLRTLPHDRDP